MFEDKEKRIIIYLSVFLIGNFLFYFFLTGNYRKSYFSKVENFSQLRRNFLSLKSSVEKAEYDIHKWKEALMDIGFLRKNYFLSSEKGVVDLRRGLEKCAKEARVTIGEINYNYITKEKGRMGEINFSFSSEDNYFKIKKFIEYIENIQKFIILKKIDVVSSNPEGEVNVRFYLSAYTNEK